MLRLAAGSALMAQGQRAVVDIGKDVSRFISLSDASGRGGHLTAPIEAWAYGGYLIFLKGR